MRHGGGGFVLIYILCLLLLGLPVMTMEFAIGRAAQQHGDAHRLGAAVQHVRVAPHIQLGHGRGSTLG